MFTRGIDLVLSGALLVVRPEPESYMRLSCGPNPDLPGLMARETVIAPVPVTGLAEYFSTMPRIAPPPLGRLMVGACRVVGTDDPA